MTKGDLVYPLVAILAFFLYPS
ncbi:uncharacterized protein FFFS_15992 [Fusarium fujikuroi]|nr:uncharacterized protein FFFS_15992 [Fusarium fujikuroi]